MSPRRDRGPGRTSGFFKGRELLVLALFVVIAAAGWPLVIAQLRRANAPPPARPRPPIDPRPIKPDDGLAFQAVRDKTPNEFRELAAYAELLARARGKSPAELRADARRDLFFTHLWERPASYRGVPIHLEGRLKRALTYEAKPELSPKARLYEAWFITEESRRFPYVVVFEEPPPGFATGEEFDEPIVVDGYFLKLLAYRAGDTPRAAPMLVGRIELPRAAADPAGKPAVEPAATALWRNPGVWGIGLLFLYACGRLIHFIRKAARPVVEVADRGVWTHELPPDPPSEGDVAAFLGRLERGEAAPGDEDGSRSRT